MKVLILQKRKDFLRAAKGVKSVVPGLILQAAPSLSAQNKTLSENSCYLGYTATKKLGKAHIRNRTKRRLRAAAAIVFSQYALAKVDYVLIGRYNTANISFDLLKKHMLQALSDVNTQISNQKGVCYEKNNDITD